MTESVVFMVDVYFISTSQIANKLRFISNLQHGMCEHLATSPCCEEDQAPLFKKPQQPKSRIAHFFVHTYFNVPMQPDSIQFQINFKLAVWTW